MINPDMNASSDDRGALVKVLVVLKPNAKKVKIILEQEKL
jgi:hypothetical protein